MAWPGITRASGTGSQRELDRLHHPPSPPLTTQTRPGGAKSPLLNLLAREPACAGWKGVLFAKTTSKPDPLPEPFIMALRRSPMVLRYPSGAISPSTLLHRWVRCIDPGEGSCVCADTHGARWLHENGTQRPPLPSYQKTGMGSTPDGSVLCAHPSVFALPLPEMP
jgi:hypothetical protein